MKSEATLSSRAKPKHDGYTNYTYHPNKRKKKIFMVWFDKQVNENGDKVSDCKNSNINLVCGLTKGTSYLTRDLFS